MPSPQPARRRLGEALASLAPPVPLTRRESGILLLLGAAAFSQGWSANVFTHTLAYTRDTFGLTDQGIADVEVIVRATSLLALALSWWADRRGRRAPLLVAFAILPLANLATAFAPTFAAFTALQGVARIGTIALGALGLLMIAEEINPAVRGYASGIFALGLSMGTGFGLIITPLAQRERRGLARPVRRVGPAPAAAPRPLPATAGVPRLPSGHPRRSWSPPCSGGPGAPVLAHGRALVRRGRLHRPGRRVHQPPAGQRPRLGPGRRLAPPGPGQHAGRPPRAARRGPGGRPHRPAAHGGSWR